LHDKEARHRTGPVRDAQTGRRARWDGGLRVAARRGNDLPRALAPGRPTSPACHGGHPMKTPPREERTVPEGRILIVDDEPLICDTLAEYLTQEGFHATTCSSGEAALKKAETEAFDLALCDVRLPGIDGLELLRRLLQVNPEIGVLLMTAFATVDNA